MRTTVPTIILVVRNVAIVRLSIWCNELPEPDWFFMFCLKGISYFGSRLETPLPSLLTGFLGWLNGYKSVVEQQIVDNFHRSSHEEWHVYQGGPSKHKPCKQGGNSGADCSCHTGYAGCRRSLLWTNDGHGV